MKKKVSMFGQYCLCFPNAPEQVPAKPRVQKPVARKDWRYYELWYSSQECIEKVDAILAEERRRAQAEREIDRLYNQALRARYS